MQLITLTSRSLDRSNILRIATATCCLLLFAVTAFSQNSVARPYYERGLQQYENGDYEAAITSFTQAINLDPEADNAYFTRGLAKYKLGNYDSAIGDYTSAILINPRNAKVVYSRALAKFSKSDYDGSIADSNDALHLDPQYAEAYYNRGNSYYHKDDFVKAASDYGETIRLKPSFANGYWGRGSARNKMGDAEGALRDYEKAVELDPSLQSQLGPMIDSLRTQTSSSNAAATSTTREIIFGSPRSYEHKSGWFAMSVPDNWKTEDKSTSDQVIVGMSDPTGNAVVVVRVYSPTRGYTQGELGELLRTFIKGKIGTEDAFTTGDLRPQKDGSIGLSFRFNQPIEGKNFPVYGDSFIEQEHGLVGILALMMPQEQFDAKKKEAYDMLNSFRVTGVGK